MKCDFCDNKAVGYTMQQMFCYCDEHEEVAIELLNKELDYIDSCVEELDSEYDE